MIQPVTLKHGKPLLVAVPGEIHDRGLQLRQVRHALRHDGILSISELIFDPHFQSRDSILKLSDATGFHEKRSPVRGSPLRYIWKKNDEGLICLCSAFLSSNTIVM